MLRSNIALAVASMLALLSLVAWAEPAPEEADAGSRAESSTRSRCKGEEVNLNFVDADLPEVVRFIAETTGRRFILSSNTPATKITIFSPRPVCPCEAFDAFVATLAANDLTVVRRGRYYVIMAAEKAVRSPIPIYVE